MKLNWLSWRLSAVVLVPLLSPVHGASLVGVEEKPVTTYSGTTVDGMSLVYNWEMEQGTSCTITVDYWDTVGYWSLRVPDGVDFLHLTNWKQDIERYDGDELLAALKGTLSDFDERKTSGSLRFISIGFHMVDEAWDEFVPKLREKLAKLPKHAQPSWSFLRTRVSEALADIAFVKRLTKTIEEAGYTVYHGPANGAEKTPQFELGVTWDELMKRPDLGLTSPGNVSYSVSGSEQE